MMTIRESARRLGVSIGAVAQALPDAGLGADDRERLVEALQDSEQTRRRRWAWPRFTPAQSDA